MGTGDSSLGREENNRKITGIDTEDEVETQSSGNPMGSTKVTLAKAPSNGEHGS